MKLIILAAGQSSSISSSSDVPPDCLQSFDKQSTILDKTLEVSSSISQCESVLVGGYRILDIIQSYPSLRYYYNPTWDKTGSLVTLLRASSEFDDDLLIAYSDVVHDPAVVERMLKEDAEIVISFDSLWRNRYEGRTSGDLESAEVVYRMENSQLRVEKCTGEDEACELGEFTGLILIRRAVLQQVLPMLEKRVKEQPMASIISIFHELSMQFRVRPVDLRGRWAELDSETDLAQFRFGTKAETLSRLEGMLSEGLVLPQETVCVGEWRASRESVIERVMGAFSDSAEVVVRSSGLAEDSTVSSMAGEFESVLGVLVHDEKDLSGAIDIVCNSFLRDGENDFDDNQILIQPMLTDVVAAGVVFTEDMETSAPYYVINYDESGSTDSITSGAGGEHRTLIVAKFASENVSDPKMRALIDSLKEIEEQTGYHSLDIEFAIRMEEQGNELIPKVYILQVRAIAAQKDKLKVSADDVEKELKAVKSFIRNDSSESKSLCGKKVVYGVMPDWNPAEIIGINPRPLAFSLYRNVITDEVWGRSREECGYRHTFPRPGLVNLAGKPYVDVRMSFTSFVPSSLPTRVSDKLVEYAVEKLALQPELHDKVEFNVMPTAYDLNFNPVLDELSAFGFTGDEVSEIKNAYCKLTNDILTGNRISVDCELSKAINLEQSRTLIQARVAEKGVTWSGVVDLLDDCRKLGSLPFSNLARFAFIGVIQLKGLVKRGVLTQERSDVFLASIQTVAKDFVHDLSCESKDKLVAQYGHLRPGTYDITCPAYHENFDRYIDLSNRPSAETSIKFELTVEEGESISSALASAGIECNAEELFYFIRQAIVGREKGKFEFTKNLSLAMDYMIDLSRENGIDRDDLSFLQIEELLELASRSKPSNLKTVWDGIVKRRRREHVISSAIKLPAIISNEADVEMFYVSDCLPNFITQKSVTAPICNFTDSENDVDGKFCVIENADPGFDWLFSHDIAGLVTAYGGANSHMAIRCAEFEIPAVIGCGESLFKKVYDAKKVHLDCGAKRMEILGK
mgnify:CR=1 FL=1